MSSPADKRIEVQTQNNWVGIEGNVSDDHLTVGNPTTDHAVAALSADNFSSTNCTGYSDHHCWIQSGDAIGFIGTVGGYGHSSQDVSVFEENNDDDGYNNSFYPSLTLAPANHYSLFNTWIVDGQGKAIAWYAYSTTSGGVVTHIGTGWYPESNLYENMTGTVLAEASQYSESYECPFFQAEQDYGYTSSGTITGSSAISLSPDGATWSEWNSTLDGGPPDELGSPYYTGPTIASNYDAWTMYGSG